MAGNTIQEWEHPILGGTRERESAAIPARFALETASDRYPAEIAAGITRDLAAFAPRVTPLSSLDPGVLVVELPGRTFEGTPSAAAFAAAHALAERYGLVTAEPDLPTAHYPEIADPARGEEGGFPPGCWVAAEPALASRWALDAIRAPQAWAFAQQRGRPDRGAGIVVAQPDTGITRHAELDGVAQRAAYDVIAGHSGAADPLNGQNPGHGTGTGSVLVSGEAGTVVGSAPKATHMPIRAIESVVRITQVTVARAIDRAVGQGAHVVTMSLGGIPSISLHRALRRAVDADVIVLAAAGNCVRTVVWPARYSECVAIGGTNAADRIWPGSCRGSAVDISAPAQNVPRASVPRGFAAGGSAVDGGQGTSFAVALTAGVAALWLAYHGRPNLIAAARARGETLQAMFQRLARATARRPAGWPSFELGAGIIDAAALLAADLDVGRDRETVEPLRAADSVVSLVAETISPEAADDPGFDWTRHGPELADTLLSRQLPPEGPVPESVTPSITEALADAVTNTLLREALGLTPAETDGLR